MRTARSTASATGLCSRSCGIHLLRAHPARPRRCPRSCGCARRGCQSPAPRAHDLHIVVDLRGWKAVLEPRFNTVSQGCSSHSEWLTIKCTRDVSHLSLTLAILWTARQQFVSYRTQAAYPCRYSIGWAHSPAGELMRLLVGSTHRHRWGLRHRSHCQSREMRHSSAAAAKPTSPPDPRLHPWSLRCQRWTCIELLGSAVIEHVSSMPPTLASTLS